MLSHALRVEDMTRAAEMAADWWAAKLQQGDRALFRAVLVARIDAELATFGMAWLQCDYDPRDALLDAVLAAGTECNGCMGSARGILPMKHSMRVYPHVLEPKEGYGNWTAKIPVDPQV